MRYDRGDSFPFDFEPNGIPFGSKSKGQLSPRSYPIQFERKWKYSFVNVGDTFNTRHCTPVKLTHFPQRCHDILPKNNRCKCVHVQLP